MASQTKGVDRGPAYRREPPVALAFRVLGPVQVLSGGDPLPIRGLQAGLLAALLLQSNRVVTTDRLTEVLWDGSPPKTARPGLQWQVSRLRRLFDSQGDDGERLTFRAPGYVLRVEAGELDLDEFEQLSDHGRRLAAAGDTAEAAKILGRALRLWRGQPLENADLPGLARERAWLEHSRIAVYEDYFEAQLSLGRHRELLTELDQLVAAFPLRERLRAVQMLALYRVGLPSAAVAAYHQLRALLSEELGVDPGENLQRLLRAILARDRALEFTAGGRPPGAIGSIPAQLPADLTDFTGRDRDVARMDAMAKAHEDGSGAMVVAITGSPGVGKTALAVRWAHRVAGRFADGRLYADLRGHAAAAPPDPQRVLSQFLHALGVPPERVPADIDEAAGLYRSVLAGKRMLVLLDDVDSPEQVWPLLPGDPGCIVVLTGRNRFDGLAAHNGVQEVTLEPLDPAESVALLERIVGKQVRAETSAAERLARLCAGVPLALRIAASRLTASPHTSLASLVSELDSDRIGPLKVGRDESMSVRAAFDRSYRRLTSLERRLFRLLGQGPPVPITPSAAAEVAGISPRESRELLGWLADAHMLVQTGPDRYEFQDLVRAYALDLALREPNPEGGADGRD